MECLRLDGVALDFPRRPGVLKDITLGVPAGGMVVLTGRSGSGKTSVLQIASGLLAPSAGTVSLLGDPLPRGDEARARLRGRRIGIVFQHLNLLDELTVAENVALPLHLEGVPAAARRKRTRQLLQRFQLLRLADARPGRLSGGEQQRTAIARALALKPPVLLVDEPTAHLDRANATQVVRALLEAARLGAGVLVATHDEVFANAPERLLLRDGRVQAA